jgi:hypothetical protein
MTWDRAKHRQVSIESLHGQDGALVKGLDGIAYYALLADLEDSAEASPSPAPEQVPVQEAALKAFRMFPSPARRFDRYVTPDGSEWIFDQPRNPDGSYASDDESTEIVESRLDWYRCQGPEMKAEHRPILSKGSPTLEAEAAGD